MNEFIDDDILVDFFEHYRERIVEVSIYDYDINIIKDKLVYKGV